MFDALARTLRTGGSRAAAEATSNVSRLAELFAAHLGDAHHRVAQAALEATVEMVPAVGPALEPYLDRLCPALFPRLVAGGGCKLNNPFDPCARKACSGFQQIVLNNNRK